MFEQTSSVFSMSEPCERSYEDGKFFATILSTSDYLTHVRYESIESFLQQSDGSSSKSKSSLSSWNAETATLTSRGSQSGSKKRKTTNLPRMSAAEISNTMLTHSCRRCGQLVHWADAHNVDGSLKPGTPSNDPAPLSLRPMLTNATQTAATTSRRMINRNNLSWYSRHNSLQLWTPSRPLTHSFICHPGSLGPPKYAQWLTTDHLSVRSEM